MSGPHNLSTFDVARYGFIAFAVQSLHSVYVSFFVDFTQRRHISFGVFALAQVAYFFWNSTNDFVLGWLADSSSSSLSAKASHHLVAAATRRYSRIATGGILWAIVFALMWMNVDVFLEKHLHIPIALTFTVLLLVYDGCFSFVTVQHRALLVDVSPAEDQRQRCVVASSLLGALGSLVVFAGSLAYNSDHPANDTDRTSSSTDHMSNFTAVLNQNRPQPLPLMTGFQGFTLSVAFLSLAAFALSVYANNKTTSSRNRTLLHPVGETEDAQQESVGYATRLRSSLANTFFGLLHLVGLSKRRPSATHHTFATARTKSSSSSSWHMYLRTLLRRGFFRMILAVWMLQEFCCTTLTNIFLPTLAFAAAAAQHQHRQQNSSSTESEGPSASLFGVNDARQLATLTSAILALSFLLPQGLLVLILPFVRRYGMKVAVLRLLWARAATATAMLLWFLLMVTRRDASARLIYFSTAFFLLALRLLTECICRLQPLVLADVCDALGEAEKQKGLDQEGGPHRDGASSYSRAASLYGAAALGAKPAQSLAPLAAYLLLAPQPPLTTDDSSADGSFSGADGLRLLLFIAVAVGGTALTSALLWRKHFPNTQQQQRIGTETIGGTAVQRGTPRVLSVELQRLLQDLETPDFHQV